MMKIIVKNPNSLPLYEFYSRGEIRSQKTGERYCQAMFNLLCEVRPDLAEKIRGTDMDPFYASSNQDPRWARFVEFIEANWYY